MSQNWVGGIRRYSNRDLCVTTSKTLRREWSIQIWTLIQIMKKLIKCRSLKLLFSISVYKINIRTKAILLRVIQFGHFSTGVSFRKPSCLCLHMLVPLGLKAILESDYNMFWLAQLKAIVFLINKHQRKWLSLILIK